MIDIFTRLNTYTVKLNAQELRNAIYLGYFKQAAYRLGRRYAQYFLDSKILSRAAIARMSEATLTSELLIQCLGGIASNKDVDKFYSKYESEEGELPRAENLMIHILAQIETLYGSERLAASIFRKEPLFYSLFSVFRHAALPLPEMEGVPQIREVGARPALISSALDALSAVVDEFGENGVDQLGPRAGVPFSEFVDRSRRRTADTTSRRLRARYIGQYIFDATRL